MAYAIPKYAGYSSGYVSPTTGKKYAANQNEARGNFEAEYLNPATSVGKLNQLYSQYGSNRGWMPLAERTASTFGQTAPAATPAATTTPAATVAPTPAAPLAATKPLSITPANQKEIYPYLTTGKPAANPMIPKFNWDVGKQQDLINKTTQVGNVNSYIPKIESTPTYQYQLEAGQRALDQKLAAEGLTGSGASIEATRRMIGDLTAKEADRAVDIAKTDQATNAGLAAQRLGALGDMYGTSVSKYANDVNLLNSQLGAQSDSWKIREQEAQRLADAQILESQRVEREGNTNWARLQDLIATLQNQNILNYGSAASNSLADLYPQIGQQTINYLSQM